MEERHNALRRAVLKYWLEEQERSQAWVARHIGATRAYICDVLGGKRPFTDTLARRLYEELGIRFDYRDPIMDEATATATEEESSKEPEEASPRPRRGRPKAAVR
jgi:plasmid maintenance system antidote protein VapI